MTGQGSVTTVPPHYYCSCPRQVMLRFMSHTVVKKPVSPEELQTPGGPYIKRTFTVSGLMALYQCTTGNSY